MKKIPLLLTSLSALAAPWIQAKVPVFLTPDEKAALFMEVDSSKLLLPKDASNPTKASEGWKQAKYAVEQVGFTEKTNVMKELSLKPGSKIYSKAEAGSSLLAITNGQESVQILEPAEWTKVSLSKPITVYFLHRFQHWMKKRKRNQPQHPYLNPRLQLSNLKHLSQLWQKRNLYWSQPQKSLL